MQKFIGLLLFVFILLNLSCQQKLYVEKVPKKVANENIEKAADIWLQFRKSSPFLLDHHRLSLLNEIENYSDKLDNTLFKTYLKSSENDAVIMEDTIPILYFYREAFNKVLYEVKNTKVENVQGVVNLIVLRWGEARENNLLGTNEGQVKPNYAILSHLIELRHKPYPNGQASISKTLEHLPSVICEHTILPFWGERMRWKNGVFIH